MTRLILRSSLVVACLLTLILFFHDIANFHHVRGRAFIALGVIVYLVMSEVLLRSHYASVVNWLIIILYGVISYATLFVWGINAPVGILSAGFVVILPSLLIGSRYIPPVTIASICLLFVIQAIHEARLITPNIGTVTHPALLWDVFVYATVFSIFAIVSWLSRRQIELSLERAKEAEATVTLQKESLKNDLERESVRLRNLQLQEIRQLHKFALVGQSTAATLHELSNHLSVLNLDLDDIRQQSKHSQAIQNANETIRSINQMVQAVRRQFNSYDESSTFHVGPVLRRAVRDSTERYTKEQVSLRFDASKLKKPCTIAGDELALNQVVHILTTNALDACKHFDNPEVIITAKSNRSSLIIVVADNGLGISKEDQQKLFLPVKSAKPSGLGVGLYIARYITESHFNGTISFRNLEKGASFTVTIPLTSKGPHD